MPDLPYHHDMQPRFETSFGLRVKWFGRWGGDPEWTIEPSRLASDLVCFFYLEAGACTAVVNGVPVSMQPGELVVLRGADVFSFTQNPLQPQTSLSACLSLAREDTANQLMQIDYRRHYQLPDPTGYERRFMEVLAAFDANGRWQDLHVTAATIKWLAELHDTLRPGLGPAGNPRTINRMLAAQEWIRQRLDQEVSVAAWAAACGLNPDYFSRSFKTHIGRSPKVWLLEARLQRAARMLAVKGTRVAETAVACGFNCAFHFSRTFKRRFGLPPASYHRLRQVRGFQNHEADGMV